ncbi:MAG: peptidoglycan editing factor PgeF [Calditrichota bacterium]
MIHSLNYSIFNNYQEIVCQSIWKDEDKIDGIKPNRRGIARLDFDLEEFGLDVENTVFARQVHGNVVKYLSAPGIVESCDGLISGQPGLSLVIRTADCAAVMMFDWGKRIIANLHVGWRGARENIIYRGLQVMMKEHDCKPADILVAVSPFIHSCCYEVGKEFKNFFDEKYLSEKEGKFYFDLSGKILDELLSMEINIKNIELNGQCTFCYELQFPSFRRNGTKNRLLNVIKIKE